MLTQLAKPPNWKFSNLNSARYISDEIDDDKSVTEKENIKLSESGDDEVAIPDIDVRIVYLLVVKIKLHVKPIYMLTYTVFTEKRDTII